MMENLIKIDDLGVPLFLETPISFRGHALVFGGVPSSLKVYNSKFANEKWMGLEDSNRHCFWRQAWPYALSGAMLVSGNVYIFFAPRAQQIALSFCWFKT